MAMLFEFAIGGGNLLFSFAVRLFILASDFGTVVALSDLCGELCTEPKCYLQCCRLLKLRKTI